MLITVRKNFNPNSGIIHKKFILIFLLVSFLAGILMLMNVIYSFDSDFDYLHGSRKNHAIHYMNDMILLAGSLLQDIASFLVTLFILHIQNIITEDDMWYLLAIALLTLQFNKKFSVILLAITTAVAAYTRVLDVRALAFLAVLAIIAVTYCKLSRKGKMTGMLLESLLLLASVGLMLHIIPGFHNLRILDNIRVGPESALFSMYYNFDKAIIPFVLCICMKTLFTTETRPHVRLRYWLMLVVSVPALLITAARLGGLKVEIHHPEWLFFSG
ncbi:hypothetical protein J9T78_004565 [Salmonella enterica]|nr:hypothetical protein [Salmonella enterica]EHI5678506.1 hypothetical protein [Salmonella enterica]EHO4426182.1 hypothetical protein [Salmonella enterica]